jgi:hypothetical protein
MGFFENSCEALLGQDAGFDTPQLSILMPVSFEAFPHFLDTPTAFSHG